MTHHVCICGGGNLGHVVAGVLAAREDCEVSLLTRHPERWQHQLSISTPDGKVLEGTLRHVTDRAADVVPQASLVLLCLPGFAIGDVLTAIGPWLRKGTPVGSIVSSTGFFFEALAKLPPATPLYGFQRVPFIARATDYGHAADLLGYKPAIHVAIEHCDDKEALRQLIEHLLGTRTLLLGSHYEASLTNSNPLLHPARLYNLWSQWHKGTVYAVQPRFYEDWTDEASALLIAMDGEFFSLLSRLPVGKGSLPTILDYYESHDAPSLTRKLRSIAAFKGILAPMVAVDGGFIPDLHSRYFTEDFPYGLAIVQRLAREHQVSTPTIDRVMAWGLHISTS